MAKAQTAPRPAEMTEQDFEHRRAELKRHIVAAENDRKAVAYRLELGQATPDDLVQARQAVEELQDRLGGLDEAQRRAKDEAARNAAAAMERRRAEAHGAVEKALSARVAAAQAVVEAVDVLGKAWADYRSLGTEVVNTAAPWLKGTERADLNWWTINPNDRADYVRIMGTLYAAGIDLSNIDGRVAYHATQERGLVAWVRMMNVRARDLLPALKPDERDEAA